MQGLPLNQRQGWDDEHTISTYNIANFLSIWALESYHLGSSPVFAKY